MQDDLRAQKIVAKRIKAQHLPQKMSQFDTAPANDFSKRSSNGGKRKAKGGNKSQRKHAIKMKKK